MKRLASFLVAILMMAISVGALADGNSYQQEGYAQEYYVLSNNVQIYRDSDCKSAVGTLNFGDKVFLQTQSGMVSYVMCDSINTFAYIRNSQIGQPLKQVYLTGYVNLSPTKEEWYDNSNVYGAAIGGYRIKEYAFVLCELQNHYLLLTDAGCMGWVRKDDSGIQEIESYRVVNSLNTDYYWNYTKKTNNQYYEGDSYRVLRPSLKLYNSNSTSSGSSAKVTFGAKVEILNTEGAWCLVSSGGNSGWLRKVFLENPEMRLRINGKVRLAPLPGMNETDYAVAAGGVVKTGEAYVVTTVGDYYLIVTANGACGFVHKDNQNIQILETYQNYNYREENYDYGYYGDYDYDYGYDDYENGCGCGCDCNCDCCNGVG